MKIHRRTLLIAALAVLAALVCLALSLLASNWRRGEQTTVSLANHLGHSAQNKIAVASQCWDIFTRCGTLVIFTTSQTLAELDQQVESLDMGFSNPRRADGYGVFTSINLDTSRNLTADGSLGMTDRFDLPEPEAYEWQASLTGSKEAKISYYIIQNTGSVYALDGARLSENILVVLVQDRR